MAKANIAPRDIKGSDTPKRFPKGVTEMTKVSSPFYIRRKGSDCWHWMKNCRYVWTWGGLGHITAAYAVFDVRRTRPHGDLCNQCKAKERAATRSGKVRVELGL